MMKTSNKLVSRIILSVVAIASTSQCVFAAPSDMVIPRARAIDLSKVVTEAGTRSPKDKSKMDLKLKMLVKQFSSSQDRSAGLTMSKSELQRLFGISDKVTNPAVEVAISTNQKISKEAFAEAGAKVRMQLDSTTFASIPVQSLETVAKLEGVQYMRAIVTCKVPKPLITGNKISASCLHDTPKTQSRTPLKRELLKPAPPSLLAKFRQERMKLGVGSRSAKICSRQATRASVKVYAAQITPWKSIFARVPSLNRVAPVLSE